MEITKKVTNSAFFADFTSDQFPEQNCFHHKLLKAQVFEKLKEELVAREGLSILRLLKGFSAANGTFPTIIHKQTGFER